MGRVRREVVHQLLGRCDACQQQHMRVVQTVERRNVLLTGLEQRLQGRILQRGEIQTLIGIEVHGLGHNTVFHGLQVLGTLGDDDNVCTVLAA